jgi:hypothetical protein
MTPTLSADSPTYCSGGEDLMKPCRLPIMPAIWPHPNPRDRGISSLLRVGTPSPLTF